MKAFGYLSNSLIFNLIAILVVTCDFKTTTMQFSFATNYTGKFIKLHKSYIGDSIPYYPDYTTVHKFPYSKTNSSKFIIVKITMCLLYAI